MSWWRFGGRQLARAALVVIAVAVLAQLLVEAAPGTPGERAARAGGFLPADDSAVAASTRAAVVERIAVQRGLDRPLVTRVGSYLAALVVFDFGRSWRDDLPVRPLVVEAVSATLLLCLCALLIAAAAGAGLAVAAVWRRASGADLALAVVGAIALAVPPVWLAVVALRWSSAPVVAVLVLALVPAVVVARYLRAALTSATVEPWAIAVRARGASRARLLAVHGLRYAASPLMSLMPVLTTYLLGAALVVEPVFGVRGLGALVVDASARGDAPVVTGATIAVAAALACVSTLADAAQRVLDPRLREGPRGA